MSSSRLRRLEGKVAIVTGAGSSGPGVGNGKATAILFARHGARVALVDHVQERAQETRGIIAAEGGQAIALAADVTDLTACQAVVEATLEAFGPPAVLVNNVGILGAPGDAVSVDPDEWDRSMQVNVKSMVLMTKVCVPHMAEAGGGSIVNLSSVAGLTGGQASLAYPTSKGAIVNLTRAMAGHHGRQGIRVNAIAPGMVYTPMVAGGMSPAVREARRKRSLLQTEGTAWDVAMAAVFLASDEARWVSGLILPVDAGATAGRAEPLSPPSDAGQR